MSDIKQATNAARNVLMNELGLTRDAVRQEMRLIVQDVVDKQIAQIPIERIVSDIVEKHLSKNWSETAPRNAVLKAIKEEAQKRAEKVFTEMFPERDL